LEIAERFRFYKRNQREGETVLAYYDPSLPLRLACDASPVGIGAVLSHVMHDGTERPTAFASRTLTKIEQKYAQIDKEALSIIW